MKIEQKVLNFEREVWHEYTINLFSKKEANIERTYLVGLKQGIKTNYNLPLKERRKYMTMIELKLRELE